MDLTFVRHGEPASDGASDPGLSERGVDQARRAAEFLAAESYHALYVSPLARARQTAEPIAAAVGLSPVAVDGLAEFGSHLPYERFEDLAAAGDPRVDAYLRGDLSAWDTDADEFRREVMGAVQQIVADHRGQRVVLVSHGGVANAFFSQVLGLTRLAFFAPAYASISRARAGAGQYTVVSLNECGHLVEVDRNAPWEGKNTRIGDY